MLQLFRVNTKILFLLPNGDLKQYLRMIPAKFEVSIFIGFGRRPKNVNQGLTRVGDAKTTRFIRVTGTYSGFGPADQVKCVAQGIQK